LTILEQMNEINQIVTNLGLNAANFQEPSDEDAYELLMKVRKLFRDLLRENDIPEEVIKSMLTKFNDSGRRSPPWQEGNEHGNRQNRWLFANNHPYHATQSMGCLVEIKFVLQTLSMRNAPNFPSDLLRNSFTEILNHELVPGTFSDPLTGDILDFNEFANDGRYVESSHITPHARGGRHSYENSTLMHRDSNRLQADLPIGECLDYMVRILRNHGFNVERIE